MSLAPSRGQPPPGQCLRLSNVDWRTYLPLLHAFGERPGILSLLAGGIWFTVKLDQSRDKAKRHAVNEGKLRRKTLAAAPGIGFSVAHESGPP
jgi:hypothetical protein